MLESHIYYEKMAMDLGMHVRRYAFDTWRAWIKDYYTSSPSFSAEEAEIFNLGNRMGALGKAIKYVKKSRSAELKKWCIKPAIRNFLIRNKK